MASPIFRVLTPDAQYHDDAEVEREAGAGRLDLVILREREAEAIPDHEWASAEALLIWHEVPIDAAVVQKLERCRLIVRAGVGFDHVDLAAAGRAGIPVCNTPDYGTSEVADHAIALFLALRRGLMSYQNALIQDPVNGFHWGRAPLVKRVRGCCFGVLGLGRIGTATALRAKALGCEVITFDPYLPRGQEIALGVRRLDSFHAFLGEAEVVSVHAPLTAETHNLLDEEAFAAMRPGALLINTARGGVVDLHALLWALDSGQLAGCGLDVFPREPAEPNHPFWQAVREQPDGFRERVIVSPHAAWYSPESQYDARRLSTETVLAYLSRGELRNCVNEMFLTERR